MTTISAILLIPADGDAHGLLRDGPCGARPPTVMHPNLQAWDECAPNFAHCPAGSPCSGLNGRERDKCIDIGACRGHGPRRALVLAWDGDIVPDGCDRADWCRASARGSAHTPGRDTAYLVLGVLGRTMRLRDHTSVLADFVADLGTIVLLDADGREVTP